MIGNAFELCFSIQLCTEIMPIAAFCCPRTRLAQQDVLASVHVVPQNKRKNSFLEFMTKGCDEHNNSCRIYVSGQTVLVLSFSISILAEPMLSV